MSRKAELGFSAFLTLVGGLYFLAATQYPVGEMTNPGPGMMPRILGIVLIGLSAYILVKALLERKPKEKNQLGEAECPSGKNTPLWITLVMVPYTATLDFFGFPLATFLALFIVGKILGLEGWKTPLLLTVCVVTVAMLVFVFTLDVPLPKGTIWER